MKEGTSTATFAVEVAVSTIVVSSATAAISVGGRQQFLATLQNDEGNTLTNRSVTWSSNRTDIATVVAFSGMVSAVRPGTANIMASSEGKSGVAELAVTWLPAVEREALVTLYDETGGASWISDAGWLLFDNPCTWFGVSCSDGHMKEISLSENNLSGSIPASLGELSALGILDLWGNNLTGSIPPALGDLTALDKLILKINELGGRIPVELGKLTSLTILDLQGNELFGSIPVELGALTQLIDLRLNSNRLSGVIPEELKNLTSLWLLDLGFNDLADPVPVNLGGLTTLEHLSLGGK